MKTLNLFAGLGGNRKLWNNGEVTAVELNALIAKIYQENYPKDTVIIEDAGKYLIKHYKEFDFIWASPECQTHSCLRFMKSKAGAYSPKLPDFSLYSFIVFLSNYYEGKWVVENVEPYYEPLIKPTVNLGHHLFWSNYPIPNKQFEQPKVDIFHVKSSTKRYGFSLEGKGGFRKDHYLRSYVNPEIGKYVFECAISKAPKLEHFLECTTK